MTLNQLGFKTTVGTLVFPLKVSVEYNNSKKKKVIEKK